MKNPFDKSNEIYGSETLYREIGYYTARLEHYSRSLKFFDDAIQRTPDDRRALLGRARARAKVSQYQGALEDCKHALDLDPDDLVVLGDRALNTYLCGEFEDGLVQNVRLLPRRRCPDVFSVGTMHCYEAIENCVGERAGRPLRDHFRIIRKLAWKRNYAAQKPFEPLPARGKVKKKKKGLLEKLTSQEKGRIKEPVQPLKMQGLKGGIRDSLVSRRSDSELVPPYTQPFPFKPLQAYTSNIENYIAEKYLDMMYRDKVFLKEFHEEPGSYCPNKKGTAKLKRIAKICYKTVSYKQELLRMRRPFYFIKYQEARVSETLKQRQQVELEQQRLIVRKEADAILATMILAYKERRLRDFLALIEKLRRYCNTKSKKTLPNKNDYMRVICTTVCKAFYDVYRINSQHNMFETNMRLYALLGLPLSRESSRDSVIGQFKNQVIDFQKKMSDLETRLQNATQSDEICWLYHELSRHHLDLKQFDMSRLYARKCIQEATSWSDMWIFNSIMLMCKGDLMQHNKSDAFNDLAMALKVATRLKDDDKIEYVKRCVDVINAIQFDDQFGAKELEKREKKIVAMMTGTRMKNEVSHLFRQMSAMPASRRMTVIPGVVVPSAQHEGRTGGRAMSIMPNAGRATNGSVRDLKKVKSDKDLMNIIELHL